MPKLVITREGVNLREYKLDQPRVSIGRKPDSDVFLDDQTVSSEHAAVSLLDAPAITDLGSTNGTQVNGVRVSKQPLHHGDVIRIGQHELKFIDEGVQDLNATMVLAPATPATGNGVLHVLSGPKAGTSLPLDKDRVTLGKPGSQVAVVIREAGGFRLLPVTGNIPTRVNQRPVVATGVMLAHGDEIEIAGNRIRFEVA